MADHLLLADEVLDWLHAHPDQVAGILDRLQVADGWELDETGWARHDMTTDTETAADVIFDEEAGLWEADVAGLGVIGMYATAEEAMAAADEALVERLVTMRATCRGTHEAFLGVSYTSTQWLANDGRS